MARRTPKLKGRTSAAAGEISRFPNSGIPKNPRLDPDQWFRVNEPGECFGVFFSGPQNDVTFVEGEIGFLG